MKIAMISEHANPLQALGGVDAGGQNVYVDNLASKLTQRGHDVTVFTRRDDPVSAPMERSATGYWVERVPIGPQRYVPKDELWPYMPAFATWLRHRWEDANFDVAHAHFWMSGTATMWAKQDLELPVVQTFHALGTVKRRHQGSLDTSPDGRLRAERDLCQQVDRVIATCCDEVAELRALGLDPSRVSVVPCGIDTSVFRPLGGINVAPRTRPRLLVAGRLVRRKGIGNVIRALSLLPGVDLVIVGGPAPDNLFEDPSVRRLCQIATECGVADRVIFTGGLHQTEVAQWMNDSDVVVAVPWYEPFGMVPVEAMACGRPVVGSAVGGLLDTIVPGITGELVPPRRPEVLASTLRRLLASPSKRAAYGVAGRQRALKYFQWDRVAAEVEETYEAVLMRRPLVEAV